MLTKSSVMKLLLFAALACASRLDAEQSFWQPEKTWVFAVGVMHFDDPAAESWPDEGRADMEMIRALEKRGVPPNQILFIKNEQATHANIVRQFDPFLRRAGSEDTLIFYYAGHGSRDYSKADRPCAFQTFDSDAQWPVDSIFDSVERNFHGQQVIYTADCCHSGALAVGAAQRRTRAAVLTSTHVASTSTSNWMFTNCLAWMFEGSSLLDLDNNGQVTFAETAHHIRAEMAFIFGQYAEYGVSGGFPADTVMSKATGPHTVPEVGKFIEGEAEGLWWKAVVLAEREGSYLVTWPGWSKEYDEWLPMERTRPYRPKIFQVGHPVQAVWRKQWYDARVVKVELGLHLVHYDGFPDTDDEWVVSERLRKRP